MCSDVLAVAGLHLAPLLRSQFMECKYDFWGNMAVAGTDFPTRPGTLVTNEKVVEQRARAAKMPLFKQVNPGRCDKSSRNQTLAGWQPVVSQ